MPMSGSEICPRNSTSVRIMPFVFILCKLCKKISPWDTVGGVSGGRHHCPVERAAEDNFKGPGYFCDISHDFGKWSVWKSLS